MSWAEFFFAFWGMLGTTFGTIVGMIQLQIWNRERQEKRIDTFASIERDAIRLLEQIEAVNFIPDFVLGLGRSGAFLGGWIAGNLGSIPIEVIERVHLDDSSEMMEFPHALSKLEFLKAAYGSTAKVLIVEGATTTGTTFFEFHKIRNSIAPEWVCKSCVLYQVKTNRASINFFARKLNAAPERYAWHRSPKWKRALGSDPHLLLF